MVAVCADPQGAVSRLLESLADGKTELISGVTELHRLTRHPCPSSKLSTCPPCQQMHAWLFRFELVEHDTDPRYRRVWRALQFARHSGNWPESYRRMREYGGSS